MPSNQVTISVKRVGNNITVTVNPDPAHVKKGEPMIWQVDPHADVDEVEIDRDGAKWPFTDAPPYKSKKNSPKSVHQRKGDWVSGDTAKYKVSGTCQGQKFVLDPDMIVD
ncbi:MAG: hypothetical protein WC700_09930 [Gemmatimonadaceae bacterium]|jgi:hypothetical protein